jgi:putative tryptophan/tyrosine transport system substrate-binding protein
LGQRMQFDRLKRREFTALLGGATALPLVARAQQGGRMRRIGVLFGFGADDPGNLRRVTAIAQGLQELGWIDGRNMRIDYRWAAGDLDRYRSFAEELIALSPDVVLTHNTALVRALQQASRSVPIVFVGIADPVGGGLVASLARPDGNATGFSAFEYGFGAKWLELLKEIAPRITRVAVIRNPVETVGIGQFAAIQAIAPLSAVELSPIDGRDTGEIDRALAAFARGANGGLIVPLDTQSLVHRDLIITLAALHRLPAVYPHRLFSGGGGLISYGPDVIDQFRRAAGYVDRILKGEKPADLPVQAPTKYELVINLKTAKALGLIVPPCCSRAPTRSSNRARDHELQPLSQELRTKKGTTTARPKLARMTRSRPWRPWIAAAQGDH